MITREDLKRSKMRFTAHLDGSDYFQNHFRNDAYPRLTCVVTSPRRRGSKVGFSKRFFVDDVEASRCSDLLDRLNDEKLTVVAGAGDAGMSNLRNPTTPSAGGDLPGPTWRPLT